MQQAASSPLQRTLKSSGFAGLTLLGLAATQHDFTARLYDWLLYGERSLLICC